MRQQVEDCLERLRTDLGRWLALLTHDSGTLVAWAGPGDPAAMAHYCQARADLTHLVMRECDWPSRATSRASCAGAERHRVVAEFWLACGATSAAATRRLCDCIANLVIAS